LIHRGETSGIIPHGPTDAVLLERHAHVVKPRHSVCCANNLPIATKLVTRDEHMMLSGPRSRHPEFPVNSCSIPVLFTITKQVVLRRLILNGVEHESHGFRRRRIWNIFVERQVWTSPRCALVRECKRLVKMKVVNHVRVGIRLEKKHFVESRPAMSAGNDGVIRSARTDRCDQFSLYSIPAITVLDHRLIDHFQEDQIGIAFRKMSSKSTPKLRKCFDISLFSIHPQLELVTRMDVDDDRQPGGQN